MLQKNYILQTSYKILNRTDWSFLQVSLILRMQDLKSCKPISHSLENGGKLQQVPFFL